MVRVDDRASLKDAGAGGFSPDDRSWPSAGMAIFAFVLAVTLVSILGAPDGVLLARPEGTLLDTDGYTRFLRVERLASGDEWFNPISVRSNYPFGESQHWTRAVDLYILALTGLVSPFSEAPLVWATVVNGPLLALSIGLALCWAMDGHARSTRSLVVLMLLGSLPVMSYGRPGRMDHHGALLLCFVVVLGLAILRPHEFGWRRASALALTMTLGIWISTEFLVPVGLVALTLAGVAVAGSRRSAVLGIRTFGLLAVGLMIVLLLERGGGLWTVEYDRVSVVHVACAAVGTVVLALLHQSPGSSWRHRLLTLSGLLAAAAIGLFLSFPDIVHGPFAEVDPQLKAVWLDRVAELQPVWNAGGRSAWILLGPILLGAAAWALQMRRERRRPWVVVSGAWLLVYLLLTSLQVRWAMFGHVLAIPLVASTVSPWIQRLSEFRWTALLRPVLVVAVVFGVMLTSAAVPQSSSHASIDCNLADIAGTLRERSTTTVLADQDLGPELLYRTDHHVIGTPYHRNTGILFSREVMKTPVSQRNEILDELAHREVGLILICPEADYILRPAALADTLYGALAVGPRPDFVEPIDLPSGTDFLLFAVEV